jgi:NADPH:quinone reductase-like Zn-dependent oxidoreductase
MNAIRFYEYGPPSVLRLEDAPKPTAEAGEVLVRIHAASVNPVDTAIRAGYLRAFRKDSFPVILGWDFSGVIESVGEGVTQWRPGDEVFGHPALNLPQGTYAEYIAVPETMCVRKPSSIDHAHAAAIPLAALTAWQVLFDHLKLAAGQTVLIQGGAGGVGSFAIQFGRQRGIRVAATASTRNQDLLRELGADVPIDYQTTRFEDVLPEGVDAAIDGVGGEIRRRSWSVLKPGATIIALTSAPPTDADAAAEGVRQKTIWVRPNASQLAEIAQLVDAGAVRPVIDSVVPLAEAARAHELSESRRVRGKIVLQVV